MNATECALCGSRASLFNKSNDKAYFKCANCLSVFLDPEKLPSREEERKRYELHNNDVEDGRYRAFVAPIVREIKRKFTPKHKGLDFGAGTGPVITKLLRDDGFTTELYDPLFWNRHEALETTYDYIACCEVIEHFHDPRKEFALLRSLLKPAGVLYCMTEPYSDDIDFDKWYYKNDETHVFFYHKQALVWIRDHMRFSRLEIRDRLIQFSA